MKDVCSTHHSVIEIPQPLIIPPADEINIALVGAGGTGSFIAQFLGRLAWHTRRLGTRGAQYCIH